MMMMKTYEDIKNKIVTKVVTYQMPLNIKLIVAGIILVIGLALGFYGGYKLYAPTAAVNIERPTVEVVQADGSKILAKAPADHVKAPMEIPKGGKVERVVTFSVKQKASVEAQKGPTSASVSKDEQCPPIDVSIALVSNPDQSRSVIVKSDNGEIVGGLDIPNLDVSIPKPEKKWAAGISYNSDKQGGVWVDRDLGPFRVGAEVEQGSQGIVGTVKLGIKF